MAAGLMGPLRGSRASPAFPRPRCLLVSASVTAAPYTLLFLLPGISAPGRMRALRNPVPLPSARTPPDDVRGLGPVPQAPQLVTELGWHLKVTRTPPGDRRSLVLLPAGLTPGNRKHPQRRESRGERKRDGEEAGAERGAQGRARGESEHILGHSPNHRLEMKRPAALSVGLQPAPPNQPPSVWIRAMTSCPWARHSQHSGKRMGRGKPEPPAAGLPGTGT